MSRGHFVAAASAASAEFFAATGKVTDQSFQSDVLDSKTFRSLEPVTIVGILFILISYPASLITRQLERRFGH